MHLIEPRQPTQSLHADMSRNFQLLVIFFICPETILPYGSLLLCGSAVVFESCIIQGSWVQAALDPQFFRGSVHGQDTSEPSTGETQERHEWCELSPWYDWNTVASGVKHHSLNQLALWFSWLLVVVVLGFNAFFYKMSVCKTVMPPYCHIDTGSDTVHFLISKELAITDIISGKNKALNLINSINVIVCYWKIGMTI